MKFQEYTPYEWAQIEVANNFGLDKEIYINRLKWYKENQHRLEELQDEADDYWLYKQSVKQIRLIEQGKPSGMVIRIDAVSSGIQLLSVSLGCKKGCENTGAINQEEDKRPNAYRAVEASMGKHLGEEASYDYSSIKNAVMTSCYGSVAEPKKMFNTKELKAFYIACREVAPAAFQVMERLKRTWNGTTLVHEWVMPDNHTAYVPVMKSEMYDLTVMDKYKMTTIVDINKPIPFKVSNIAK